VRIDQDVMLSALESLDPECGSATVRGDPRERCPNTRGVLRSVGERTLVGRGQVEQVQLPYDTAASSWVSCRIPEEKCKPQITKAQCRIEGKMMLYVLIPFGETTP